MGKKVLILGNHLVAEDLARQYRERGVVVKRQSELSLNGLPISDFDEVCLLTGTGEDNKAVALLSELAEEYDLNSHCGRRLICQLLVQDHTTLRILQTCELCDTVRRKIDVYPFTMAEVWCQNIVLDYEPITIQSEKHVHIVIFGMGEIAKMVAVQAAHVAHYPNYVRNHSLRTRITMVDMFAEKESEQLIKSYQHLFDNSFYRIVNPSLEKTVKMFHKPMYAGQREDFVDVEWEFVEADIWDTEILEKLKLWSTDENQLLTIVMADSDECKNTVQAMFLPDEIFRRSVPVYKYNQQETKYDVTLPLVRMAKNVNYIYACCYEENNDTWNGQLRYVVEIDKPERDKLWAELKNVKRMSNIYNAMTIPVKMRSIGLKEEEWDKFYDISQQDIELLAQVEHNRWSVEELILGFRPCTDEEHDRIEADVKNQKDLYKAKKIHYDLRSFHELRPDGTGKPVQIYDLCLSSCLPLIVKAFADEKGETL